MSFPRHGGEFRLNFGLGEMHSISNFARNFAQRKNAQHSKFRNEFRETPACPKSESVPLVEVLHTVSHLRARDMRGRSHARQRGGGRRVRSGITQDKATRWRQLYTKGSASPKAFHASRRACAFYSWYRLRPTWWAPAKSKDIVARARSFRVRPFWPERRRMSRASTKCTEVLAGRHKSDCRSTAGEDQQGLRFCGLEGRRCMQ